MFNTFYGPDISTYQTVTDWNALNTGAAFIMIKSCGTDDGDYIDDKWEENITNARSFGNALPKITYAFCGGVDPIHDADYFVDNVGVNLHVGEAYEFDCERGNAVTPEYAKQALDHAKERLGWGGGVYVSQSRLINEDWTPVAEAGYFIHPADWADSTADNFNVGAFKTYSFQQYTDHATWPGISAPCDGNAFFGNDAIDILKFGKPADVPTPPVVIPIVVTPPPVPTPIVVPSPDPVTVDLPGTVITPDPVIPDPPTTTPPVQKQDVAKHWYDPILNFIVWLFS